MRLSYEANEVVMRLSTVTLSSLRVINNRHARVHLRVAARVCVLVLVVVLVVVAVASAVKVGGLARERLCLIMNHRNADSSSSSSSRALEDGRCLITITR